MHARNYAQSLLVATCIVVVLVAMSSIPHLELFGVFLLPGALVAAVFFPEGIHSSHSWTFFALAGILDCVFLAFVVASVWTLARRLLKPRAQHEGHRGIE